ncbi:MAG: choice-of-anchor tandem repeat GloVer-containing protein, partial [Candidatus Cybelea sp.]
MRISPLDSGTLAVCAAAMLAGSGGLLSPSPAGPSTALRVTIAEQTRPSHRYDVLYSFKGGSSDGAYPEAALVNVKGKFYGTTYGGGANGDGTVFAITKFGTETVLYSFEDGGDANLPEAGLINVNRTLYGTTYGGGKDGDGTVFA